MSKTDNPVQLSKRLSLILRHKPESIGLNLDKNGWADVSFIIKAIGTTYSDIENAVNTNNKKRFEFDESGEKIRARQGHSINVDVELEEKAPPKFLYHGTPIGNASDIKRDGLLKMKRNHVHLSEEHDTAVNVGQRRSKNVIVFTVHAEEMYNNGCKFYLSRNGVWLTEYVDPKYIS